MRVMKWKVELNFREREGLILSQCRLESGLSQEYVARQMDVNIRTVRNWEEGLSLSEAMIC